MNEEWTGLFFDVVRQSARQEWRADFLCADVFRRAARSKPAVKWKKEQARRPYDSTLAKITNPTPTSGTVGPSLSSNCHPFDFGTLPVLLGNGKLVSVGDPSGLQRFYHPG
jgi:hypothetical protein